MLPIIQSTQPKKLFKEECVDSEELADFGMIFQNLIKLETSRRKTCPILDFKDVSNNLTFHRPKFLLSVTI